MTWQNVDSIKLHLNSLKKATFGFGKVSFVFGRAGCWRGRKEVKI